MRTVASIEISRMVDIASSIGAAALIRAKTRKILPLADEPRMPARNIEEMSAPVPTPPIR